MGPTMASQFSTSAATQLASTGTKSPAAASSARRSLSAGHSIARTNGAATTPIPKAARPIGGAMVARSRKSQNRADPVPSMAASSAIGTIVNGWRSDPMAVPSMAASGVPMSSRELGADAARTPAKRSCKGRRLSMAMRRLEPASGRDVPNQRVANAPRARSIKTSSSRTSRTQGDSLPAPKANSREIRERRRANGMRHRFLAAAICAFSRSICSTRSWTKALRSSISRLITSSHDQCRWYARKKTSLRKRFLVYSSAKKCVISRFDLNVPPQFEHIDFTRSDRRRAPLD